MFNFISVGNGSSRSKEKDILELPVKEGRSHLTGKVRHALAFAYDKLNNSFDWILKCDDDSYVIMENLRHLLSLVKQNSSALLGFHMKVIHYYIVEYNYVNPW